MIELAGIEPGAQKKMMVGGMRIGNHSFKLLSMPFQGAKSGSFLGPIWAPFGVHSPGPLRGLILAETQRKHMFWSFPALQKGLVLGPFLGSILDQFLTPFPVAFPGADSRRPTQKEMMLFFI